MQKLITKLSKKYLSDKSILKLAKFRQLSRRIIKPRLIYFLFKHLKPISNIYGSERGMPIDRYYIEEFLDQNKKHIQGDCLEIEDNNYTLKYGEQRVKKSDILDINHVNRRATIYGDLRKLNNVSNNSYDCIILTQVLQYIDDCESAVEECYRILKPRGVLLATFPSIGRVDCAAGVDGDFWRFTTASANYIFSKFFLKINLEIKAWGNVLVGLGFWVGLAREELTKRELNYLDQNFPCLMTVKAIKE